MNTKLLTIITVVTLLIVSSFRYFPVSAQKGEQWTIAADPFNSRLAIQVATNGRFNMGAFPDPVTGGATGGSFNLIYAWPSSPGTSFSTVRIDGADNVYGSSGILLELPNDIDSKTNRSKWQIGDIEVTQILQIVLNNQTGQEDVARIAYTLRNTGSVSHSAGMRVMIDTMLNSNDGAPFRVPGVGIVTNEAEFFGAAIPDTFQAFFNVTDSEHVAAATVKSGGATAPDRLVLARWPGIVSTAYDYTINPNLSLTSDSAYGLYWNPSTLAPGSSRTYVSFYGLSNLQVDLQPPLALGVTGPATLSVVNGQYSPNPFDVVGTVLNNGTATATNVQLGISLPTGLSLATGNAVVAVGDLGVGQERQVSWKVMAAPLNSNTTLTYSITASASNAQSKTVQKQISVPALTSTTVPVIFIPGIMGSEIGYDQAGSFNKLWPDLLASQTGKVRNMRKRPDGSEIESESLFLCHLQGSVNKRAGDVLRTVVTRHVYRDFLKRMGDEGFQEGNDCVSGPSGQLFVFPYDWRDSLRNSAYLRDPSSCPAHNLADKISQVLAETGANQVDIVAHSMGGLVALEYLRDRVQTNRPHHIRKLITVATPYLGAPAAFQALRYGRPFEGLARLLLNTYNSKSISHNLPGAYHLLPSRTYFDPAAIGPYGAPRYVLDPDDNDANANTNPTSYDLTRHFLDNAIEGFNLLCNEDYQNPQRRTLNTVLTADADTLHTPLDSFARTIPADVSLYTIAGWGQLTNRLYEDRVQQLIVNGQPTGVFYVRTIADQAGDKSVPLWSAFWPAPAHKYSLRLPDQVEHAFMMEDTCIQNVVVGLLKNFNASCSSDYTLRINEPPSRDDVSAPQWTTAVFSPANVHLFDANGRHTGPSSQGGFEEDVPQSSYESSEENGYQQLSFVLGTGRDIRVDGTGNGTFDLKVHETVGDDTVRTIIFRKVPVNERTRGYIHPEFGGLPILRLDTDGDGVIDLEILPMEVFDGRDPSEFAVDIMPGSTTNPINLQDKGVIPLAVLGSEFLDTRTIDPLSVRFGRGQAIEAHRQGHYEDVNGDGRTDLVLHFRTQESGILATDRAVCLTGNKKDGTPFQGCDAITVIR